MSGVILSCSSMFRAALAPSTVGGPVPRPPLAQARPHQSFKPSERDSELHGTATQGSFCNTLNSSEHLCSSPLPSRYRTIIQYLPHPEPRSCKQPWCFTWANDDIPLAGLRQSCITVTITPCSPPAPWRGLCSLSRYSWLFTPGMLTHNQKGHLMPGLHSVLRLTVALECSRGSGAPPACSSWLHVNLTASSECWSHWFPSPSHPFAETV